MIKKRVTALLCMLILLMLSSFAFANPYGTDILGLQKIPSNVGYHELRFIANSSEGYSVDANENGVIDIAESVLNTVPDMDWDIIGNNMYSIVSGNVGIGVNNPGQKLHVLGNIQFDGELMPNGITCNNDELLKKIAGQWTCAADLGAGGDIDWIINGANMYTDPNVTGNVGIGVNTPIQKLDVAGNIQLYDQIQFVGNAFNQIQSANNADLQLATQGSGLISFRPGGSEIMIINPAGNVGIGTNAPVQRLDVTGYVRGSTGLCIGNDCRNSWPADTRCDSSGTCNQLCIGSDCKNSWPSGGGSGDIEGVTAGNGLTGGGTSGTVTLDVAGGTGITANANDVALTNPSKSCGAGTAIQSFNLGSANAPTCVAVGGEGGSADGYIGTAGSHTSGGQLSMNSNKITNLAVPTDNSDAATKQYVDSNDDVGITSEADPEVSSVTSGKWCRGTGSAVTCDQNSPAISQQCSWINMRTSTKKPAGGNCAATNKVAYLLNSDIEAGGVVGYCKYTTSAAYGKVVYGFLETRNADNPEYDSNNRVIVCQNDWYTASVGADGTCGVEATGIAQYLKCS